MSTESDARPARIRFLTTEEGGRFSAPRTGARSQLQVGDVMTSCVITATGDRDIIALGEETDVEIRLNFPQHFASEFPRLSDARLFEGNKLVAVGVFTDSQDQTSDAQQ